MSPIKAFGVVGVMIACFVVIYPRFMHPFVLRTLGLHEVPINEPNNMYPPHYRHMQQGSTKPQHVPDDARRNTRQGPPHPGMRAAAEMQRQQSQQGSGRGMMGVVLPMYAIGIVLYLVYTLFKVFNKSKSPSGHEASIYEDRMVRDYPVDSLGLPTDYLETGDVRSVFTNDQQRMELEHLLTRVDDKNVSVIEMRMLQKRLEETEAQMSRILKSMQSVQPKGDSISSPADIGQSKVTSNDASPESESYEVVGREGQTEKENKQKNAEDDDIGKKDPEDDEKDASSNIDVDKLKTKAQENEQEIGLDKSNEEEVNNTNDHIDDTYDDGDENIEEDKEDGELTKTSNIRQRKGRRDDNTLYA
uniref:Resistance to inhibitors of cholinesterase protein 3 N-terminal domain-containing protein n=1 Tax=Arion vulgaris TaxID=1028688 RepID=A0A0B7A2D4_9EUPU